MTSVNGAQTERIGHFEGQLLTARDLQDDAAYEARLRGLHVRAMHNTWGVALGFEVNRKDDRQVRLNPGVAYDCHGREILSARTLTLDPPPQPAHSEAKAWYFDLTIAYLNDASFATARKSGAGCLHGSFRPQMERPAWRWRFAGDVLPDKPSGGSGSRPERMRLGEEIPLARFILAADGTLSQPDFTERRSAQGLVRPHIGNGQISVDLGYDSDQLAWTTSVNTASAGFNQTPFYFARLSIPRLLHIARQDPKQGRAWLRQHGPLVSVRTPTRTSFHLDVRLADARVGGTEASMLATSIPQIPATVSWIGIEPTGGCAAPLQIVDFYLYATALFLAIPFTFVTDADAGGDS